ARDRRSARRALPRRARTRRRLALHGEAPSRSGAAVDASLTFAPGTGGRYAGAMLRYLTVAVALAAVHCAAALTESPSVAPPSEAPPGEVASSEAAPSEPVASEATGPEAIVAAADRSEADRALDA